MSDELWARGFCVLRWDRTGPQEQTADIPLGPVRSLKVFWDRDEAKAEATRLTNDQIDRWRGWGWSEERIEEASGSYLYYVDGIRVPRTSPPDLLRSRRGFKW